MKWNETQILLHTIVSLCNTIRKDSVRCADMFDMYDIFSTLGDQMSTRLGSESSHFRNFVS